MSISFPANPTNGQTYTYNGKTWKWNTKNWAASGTSSGSGGGGSSLTLGSVQTGNFNASSNYIYPVNTTSGAITATLPASPTAGDQIEFLDYAGTWTTYNLTLNVNGGKFQGTTNNAYALTSYNNCIITYVDSTKGWIGLPGGALSQTYQSSVLIIGGGGGATGGTSGVNYGAGGAGGVLRSYNLNLTPGNSYTVTVGGGGAGTQSGTPGNGSTSSFTASYFATGGNGAPSNTLTGGSNADYIGAANGSSSTYGAGGGAGAGANGSDQQGGAGASSSITGTSTYYGGGGAGSPNGLGGSGGGGNNHANGTTNKGGGAGGGDAGNGNFSGGSGVVIVSYQSGVQKGTGGTVTTYTSGSNNYYVHTFNSSGTYTA